MTPPRNLVASYVEGRSDVDVRRLGRALASVSSLRVLPGMPTGWLVAVDGQVPTRHSDAASFISIEAELDIASAGSLPHDPLASADQLARLGGELAGCSIREGGVIVAARSCGGLVPLYYRVTERGVSVATRQRDLFWLDPDELTMDPLVHALWATGNAIFPDRRTFFRDVQILERGHLLEARPGQSRVRRYWDPRPDELPEPKQEVQATHARELQHLLLGRLAAGLSPDHMNLLTLSGGVDSSAVAVLSARVLGRPLATLTFVAPRTSRARAQQLSFVNPLLDELRVERRFLVDAEDAELDRLFATPLATLCYCPHPALRQLPKLGGEGFATLVSGHFADELCGYSQRLQDWVRHTRLASLLAPHWPPVYGARDVLRWGKRRLLEGVGRALLPLPGPLSRIFAAPIRDELSEWLARTRSRMLADPRPLRELAAWTELDAWIALHWEVASVLGVRPVHPFFNRSALELGFSCHPCELFGPGPKKLLRRALAGQVPDRYLQRADKGHWRRPARKERVTWDGRLSSLAACVRSDVAARRAGAVSVSELRALTQLSLFEAAFERETAIRRTIHAPSS